MMALDARLFVNRSSCHSSGRRRNDRKIDEAAAGSSIDSLRRLYIVLLFGEEDIRNEGLRITVVQWKPARLDLHHDAMPGKENMVRCRQREFVGQRLVRR